MLSKSNTANRKNRREITKTISVSFNYYLLRGSLTPSFLAEDASVIENYSRFVYENHMSRSAPAARCDFLLTSLIFNHLPQGLKMRVFALVRRSFPFPFFSSL